VNRPRSADDFATIRARMQELRRERERAQAPEGDLPRDPPIPSRPKRPLAVVRDQRGIGTGSPIWRGTQLGQEEDC
jgi:hypothetical protein